MSEHIIYQLEDSGVATIILNRPAKKNAFTQAMWAAFADILEKAKNDPAVACICIQGAGADFSSGMDLNDFNNTESDAAEHPFYIAQKALCEFDKPLIAAAKGIAIGGGATILLHADILYVGKSLKMRLPFVSLGLVPEFAASYTLQANIGARKAAELFYTAEWIDAEKALTSDIATRIYDDNDLFDEAAKKALEIAQWPVSALQATKQCLKAAHKAGLDQALKLEKAGMEKLAGGPENIEAVMAFIEKRQPDFSQFRK